MTLTSSRGVLAVGILLPLGMGGALIHSAWQQTQTGSPIPPLGTVGAALSCFLISALLVHSFAIRKKPNATTVRFSVFFVGLLWIICLGVTLESWIGAHLWQQARATVENVTTTTSHGSKGRHVYTDNIHYRYLFQEKNYAGHEVIGDLDRLVNKPLRENELLNIGSVVNGEEIYIRVNPSRPEQSFIQRRVRYIPLLLLLLSTFLLGRWIARRAVTEKNVLF